MKIFLYSSILFVITSLLLFDNATAQTYSVQWTNLVGVSVNGGSLTMTAPGGWGNAGASSLNTLPANTDGWVEYRVTSSTAQYAVGFSSIDLNASISSINFAYLTYGGWVEENGSLKYNSGTSAAVYEVMRVERKAGTIYYKRNGVIVYTSTQTSTSALIVDMAINTTGNVVSNVTCSFAAPSQQPNPVVANNAFWQNMVGTSVSATNALASTASTGWGNAGASTLNTLNPNTDGWVQFTVDNVTQQRAFGMSRTDVDANYTSIDYAFLLNASSASVLLAGASQTSFTVSQGDILRVERAGSTVYFKQNGIVVYTLTNCYTTSLIGDCSIYGNGSTISNAQTSFWIPYQQGLVPDQQEFLALKSLYDSLGGSNWTTKTNWPVAGSWPTSATSAQMATWYGITVAFADVTKISFSTNNMVGIIPSSISNLSMVNYLAIDANAGIIGSIPASIGTMIMLQSLSIYQNGNTGTVPSSFFNLPSVTVMSLKGNKLTGSIPSNIGNATTLTYLSLASNKLTGSIPPSIGNLTHLQQLDFDTNQLTGTIPNEIGNLTQLLYFDVHVNQLSGAIPYSLNNMVNLTYLSLGSNNFTGNIPNLNNLTKLTGIVINGCPNLTGPIPAWLFNNTGLTSLSLNYCALSGSIPSAIGNLTNLTTLNLQSNQFSGQLPATFGNLTKLQYLYLSSCKLKGTLPSTFSNLTSLIYLYLDGNSFEGTLNIGSLPQLSMMSVSGNDFVGAFPTSIGSSTALTYLKADHNQFTSLPSGILSLASITTINFDNNSLTSIPNFGTHVNKLNLTLTLTNNLLDFSQLKPQVGAGIHAVTYSPQKTIGVSNITYAVNGQLTIPAGTSDPNNIVTWQKQQPGDTWATINSTNNDNTQLTFLHTSAPIADEGVYQWSMTNASVSGLTLTSSQITVTTTNRLAMNQWGFQYQYDGRRRMTGKKVPGADWVYMVYDNRDRLVLTQDGNQRLTNQWTFTKYDALNRPVSTGIYSPGMGISKDTIQSNVNKYYAHLTTSQAWYETLSTATGNVHSYDNKSFPQVTDFSAYLTVTYYDNYSFIDPNDQITYAYVPNDVAPQTVGSVTYNQAVSNFAKVTGHVTGTKTRVLDTYTYWLKSVSYYDDKYRVIQTIVDDQRNNQLRTTSVVDFVGKVLASKTTMVSQAPTWQNMVNSKVVGNKLTSSGSGWGNGGASSVQQLAAGQDGWVETTVIPMTNGNQNQVAFGLAQTSATANYSTIDYCWYMEGQGAYVLENGVQRTQGFITYPGDILKIVRTGSTIVYKKNGVVMYTSGIHSATALIYDNSFYYPSSLSLNPRVSFTNATSSQILRTFNYDHANRLVKTWHSLNGAAPVLIAANEYNEIGQVVTKKLHSTNSGSTFKQNVDQRYNIRGWLTNINNSQLANDGITNSDNNDLFGMDLLYDQQDNGMGNSTQFNGNISAVKWSNNLALSSTRSNGYKYSYDAMNRILGANYLTNTASTWTASSNFAENGFSYDLNGNIQGLNRTNSSGTAMDNLTYTYTGNQLQSVTDNGDLLNGFIDGNVGTTD